VVQLQHQLQAAQQAQEQSQASVVQLQHQLQAAQQAHEQSQASVVTLQHQLQEQQGQLAAFTVFVAAAAAAAAGVRVAESAHSAASGYTSGLEQQLQQQQRDLQQPLLRQQWYLELHAHNTVSCSQHLVHSKGLATAPPVDSRGMLLTSHCAIGLHMSV
jgi:chromosome segregation ATPase